MAALPPNNDFNLLTDGDPQAPQQVVFLQQQREPTIRDLSEAVATFVVVNLLLVFVAAMLAGYAWNHVHTLLALPSISFNEAFTLAFIVRTLVLLVRL